MRVTRKKLKEKLDAYFSDADTVKSLPGLALYLGMDTAALEKLQENPRCGPLIAMAHTRIEREIVENSLKGRYNASMSSFLLKTVFGYAEKGERTTGDVKIEVAEELKPYAV